jgi:hypothetical protein
VEGAGTRPRAGGGGGAGLSASLLASPALFPGDTWEMREPRFAGILGFSGRGVSTAAELALRSISRRNSPDLRGGGGSGG